MIWIEWVDEVYLVGIQPTTSDLFPLWLRNWDLACFVLVNERLGLPFLDPIMLLITHAGSTIFWLVASVFLWIGKRKREAVMLATGIIVGGLILLPIKVMIPRARPHFVVQGSRTLDLEGGGSFPSGHSKNAFTSAVILGSRWKRLRIPLYILAFLVAISRIYVGLHWPSDVVVGSIVGWVIGKFTIRHEKKINTLCDKVFESLGIAGFVSKLHEACFGCDSKVVDEDACDEFFSLHGAFEAC